MTGQNLPNDSSIDAEKQTTFLRALRDAGICLGTRFLSWPSELVALEASQMIGVSIPLRQLYSQAFKPKALYESGKIFLNSGIESTLFRSMGTVMSIRLVEKNGILNIPQTKKAES